MTAAIESTAAVPAARRQLFYWGAITAGIYIAYLVFFPLLPAIDQSKTVLDIEIILKNGRQWIALLYLLGLAALFFSYWRMLQTVHSLSRLDPSGSSALRKWIVGFGMLCGLILIGLYPITALDVVLYVVRARLWTLYDGSPMMALPMNFPQDAFITLAGEYARQPSPYGPLWELVAQIPMQLGITSIAGGVIAMKVISLFSYLGTGILIGWHAHQDSSKYNVSSLTALTFFALNPLVLMQTIGNGHNDMLMLFLMTVGLVLWQREQWTWATLALTLAVLIKVTGFILLPLFGLAVLVASPTWKDRLTRGLGMFVIFSVTTLLAYRLTGPFPEVFDGVRYAALGRLGYSPAYAIRVVLRELFPGNTPVINLPEPALRNIFILYYAYLMIKLAQKKMTLLEVGFLAYFSQLILGSTFRIWYPLWLVPFAALNLNSRTYWRTFLFSITAELSILSYYILWRWFLRHWDWGENGPLKEYWDYWLIMTWLTVPWTFGIPILGPWLRRRKDPAAFDAALSI